ncbi:MAG: PAS domain S-box protein [Nitrospirales bacterium]
MLAQNTPVLSLHGKVPLDVRGRLTGITILFVVLTVGILVHTGITFQAQKSDGLIIDIAGRQRLLHERHLNEMLLVSRGSTVDYQSTRRILNESLGSLIHGGPALLTIGKDDVVTLPAAPSKAIRAKLNAQRGLLETFSREADAFLRLRPGDQGYGAALQALMDLNGDLQQAANEAVRLFNEHARSKLYTVITWEVAVALIIGVLGVFFTRQARQAQDDLQHEVGVRREAELQAASQEARVRAILNSTADGIITVDEFGMVLSFNPSAEQMFGYRSEEVIGRNVTMLMPPAYREQHRDSLGRYLKTGEARVIGSERELAGLRQDGQTFPVALRISEMHHLGERVFIGTMRDISERKRSELEAQRAQALIHSIVENLPDMVFVKDATDHRFVRFNKAGEELLGYSREELIGKNDYDIFPKEEADFFWEKDCEVLEGGQLVDIPEEPIKTRHKGMRVLRTKKVPIVGSDGVPEYLLGISEDITERKRADAALTQLSHQHQLILRSAAEGIYGLDLEGRTTFSNPAAAQMIGWEVEELLGQSQHAVLHHSKPDGSPYPREDCPIYAAFKDGAVHRVDTEVFWRKDGTSFPVEYTSTPIRDEQGQLAGAVVTFRDITERKKTEEELRKSEERAIAALRQSDALKSALLSSVSHELRTPLTAIKTMVSSLIGTERNVGPEIREEFLGGIDREIDYLSSLVDNLLEMSKIEAGTQEPRREWHLLEDLVEASIRRHGKGLKSRQLEVRLAEDIPSILVDGVEIQQVLVNLLDNAIKYSPSKSQVRVEAAAKPQRLEVWVSNAGPGIPREDLQRVFDRFYRVPSGSGQLKPGTGLGLAICKGIIDAHGGRIWAESTPGRETTIRFTLPLQGQPRPPGDLVRKASE